MKKCKVCGKDNPTKQSVCSSDCKLRLIREKQLDKKEHQLQVKERQFQRHTVSIEKKIAKKQQVSITKKAKSDAWDIFSLYIRLKYSDNNGNCTCATCGKVLPWKKMQAGHGVRGRGGRVLFEEKIVRPQDFYCNCVMKGRYCDFMYYFTDIEKSLTAEEYLQIKRESMQVCKLGLSDYLEVIETYKKKIEDLPAEKKALAQATVKAKTVEEIVFNRKPLDSIEL